MTAADKMRAAGEARRAAADLRWPSRGADALARAPPPRGSTTTCRRCCSPRAAATCCGAARSPPSSMLRWKRRAAVTAALTVASATAVSLKTSMVMSTDAARTVMVTCDAVVRR